MHHFAKMKTKGRAFYSAFCCTVGRNQKVIAEYIRNQLEEDCMLDQITLKEYIDPFTGGKESKA